MPPQQESIGDDLKGSDCDPSLMSPIHIIHHDVSTLFYFPDDDANPSHIDFFVKELKKMSRKTAVELRSIRRTANGFLRVPENAP